MSEDPRWLADIYGAPVCSGREPVGTISGVFADLALARVVGLEVVAAVGGRRSFLPWVAAMLRDGVVHIESPLVLVGEEQVDYYERHGLSLRGAELAALAVSPAGEIERVETIGEGVFAAA